MESDSTTPAETRTRLLLDFIALNHPDCPGCGHQLNSETICPECGVSVHLSLNPREKLSIRWLFVFVPWLSLAGSGVLNWLLYLMTILMVGTTSLAESFSMISPAQLPFALSLELMLLGSPFMIFLLWKKRLQICYWNNSTVFLLGLLPVLGWAYNLLTSLGIFHV